MSKWSDDDIVVVHGARTPIGTFLGSLKKVSATDLGVTAAKAALERSGVSADWVDSVIVGNVIQSSKDAAYIARHVGLKAGVPETVAALTVNRACASGMEALVQAAKSIRVGEAECVLAGGSENMSQVPYTMRGIREGWRMIKTDVDDMLFSALHDPMAGCSIGETVEYLASERGISRAQADAAAVDSQAKAAKAEVRLAEEICAVELTSRRKTVTIDKDENPRPGTSLEALAGLPGLYGREGVVTAGNSSGLNDAAAMLLVCSGRFAKDKGLKPLGRVRSWASVGVAPKLMGLGPVAASNKALELAGLELEAIDIIELNDSFAVQYVAVEAELGLRRERVNVNGGALALGHPMGATGARLVLSALMELARRGGGLGLCTLCVGGGQGMAVVLESLS